MFQNVLVRHSIDFNGQKLTLETGLLAGQATASVVASIGETTVMVAVVVNEEPSTSDYFPMQVIYEEKLYASGKIKGSRFIKREGRPSEAAVLTGRMIDRSLRSLFDSNIRNEIQVVVTPLSIDEVNPPDTLAVIAASAALKLCGIEQYQGPVSSARIGLLPEDRVEQILLELKNGMGSFESFAEIRDRVAEFCQLVDVKDPESKARFGQMFKMLGDKDPEWAAKLKLQYQSSTRLSQKEIEEKYPNLKLTKVINPSYTQQSESVIDLVVSGDGHNIMMVEAGANIVEESVLGECLDAVVVELKKLTDFQHEFVEMAKNAGVARESQLTLIAPSQTAVEYWLHFREDLENALYAPGQKLERADLVQEVKDKHLMVLEQILHLQAQNNYAELRDLHDAVMTGSYSREGWSAKPDEVHQMFDEENNPQDGSFQDITNKLFDLVDNLEQLRNFKKDLKEALDLVKKKIIKQNILENDRRLDGRSLDETRQITCQIDVLPRVHGSSLFQRGETQVLNVLTLGSKGDAQIIDEMEDFEETTKRYIHHYNFPQYSVGATGRYGGAGRREIGHGALAERALLPVLPSEEDFPYTMRLVSECLGSNGSTSMASTCASCLSLMAGGVPIKDIVAGVAMGLVLDSGSGNYKVLTDIMGVEDANGDMDFKVTGTKDGITALQLDNKVAGLTTEILKKALVQAKEARIHILGIMKSTIGEAKPEMSPHAPRVAQFTIPVDKIGDVIGPSGKIIKALVSSTGADIDIDDLTGKVIIFGKNAAKVKEAEDYIKKLTKEYQLGDVVEGKVFRIEAYGAFVKIDGTDKEGLIHISQISDERIKDVNSVLSMGQTVKAKVIEINERGQISLSMKMAKDHG